MAGSCGKECKQWKAASSLASLTQLEKTTTHRWRCGIPAMSKTLVGPTHWLTKSQRWSMCSTRNLHGTERSRQQTGWMASSQQLAVTEPTSLQRALQPSCNAVAHNNMVE